MREDDDRSARLHALEIALQPFQLLVAERGQHLWLQVDDIDEANEVHTVLVEAVPALAALLRREHLEEAFHAVVERIVLARNEMDLVDLQLLKEVARLR